MSERKPGYFVVTGEPGLAFGWELKAKQRGYEQRRLDSVSRVTDYVPQSYDYGADAAEYLEDLKKEREEA